MKRLLKVILAGAVAWVAAQDGAGQSPAPAPRRTSFDELLPPSDAPISPQQTEQYQRELDRLRKELAAAQAADDKDKLQKQLELQQKQIQTLEQMIRLLAEQVR